MNGVPFPRAMLRQDDPTDLISGAGRYQVPPRGCDLADVHSDFAPLTELIEGSSHAEGMIPGLTEPGRSEWLEGRTIGIPCGIDACGLMVNTEILGKARVEASFAG